MKGKVFFEQNASADSLFLEAIELDALNNDNID
jgi:hypothetical protein